MRQKVHDDESASPQNQRQLLNSSSTTGEKREAHVVKK